MYQRNDSGVPALLPTVDPITEVEPGGFIEHDDLLPGFTQVMKKDVDGDVAVVTDPADPAPTDDAAEAPKPRRRR